MREIRVVFKIAGGTKIVSLQRSKSSCLRNSQALSGISNYPHVGVFVPSCGKT